MSSFSRNTRRANSFLSPRALGAAIALTLASGAALADGAHRFVFTAYTDAAGGAEVIAGRYRSALVELRSQFDTVDLDPAATNTNRCVAYSMTLQLRQARATCDAAVHEASKRRLSVPAWLGRSEGEDLALAYSNRAVMQWMVHEDAAAMKDMAQAQGLAPRAGFVVRNVAALEMHETVARAGAPAP